MLLTLLTATDVPLLCKGYITEEVDGYTRARSWRFALSEPGTYVFVCSKLLFGVIGLMASSIKDSISLKLR